MTQVESNPAPIFISYRRSDPYSREVISDLQSVYDPVRMFVDTRSIDAGAAFPASIADGIRASTLVIALIGPAWLGAAPRRAEEDWVIAELNYAQQYGKPVLPVLLGGVAMPSPLSLPPPVQYIAYRSALPRSATTREQLLQELIAEIGQHGVSPRPRNELTGSSRLASLASWTLSVPADVALRQIVEAAQAIHGTVERCADSYAVVRFGSRGASIFRGVWLAREDQLPVVLQVRVRPGTGVTLVEARCDEAWGDRILSQRKFEAAFQRIWSALAAR